MMLYYESKKVFTFSKICCKWKWASAGEYFSSVINLSILFSTKHGRIFSSQAWRNTTWVYKEALKISGTQLFLNIVSYIDPTTE